MTSYGIWMIAFALAYTLRSRNI